MTTANPIAPYTAVALQLTARSIERAAEFYKTLQLDAYEWVTLGTTKTGIVYGLGNNASTHRE